VLIVDEVVWEDVVACNGDDNGMISITASGGSPNYLYSIDNAVSYQVSNHFIGLPAGTYDVVVSDAHNCVALWTETIIITQPEAISVITLDIVDVVSCYGDASGEIHIEAQGGTGSLRYSIDDGVNYVLNNGDFMNLTAGIYHLKIKDGSGCIYVHDSPIEINQPDLLDIGTVTTVDVTDCYNNTNGSIDISAVGGTAAYSYSIDGGITFEASNLFGNLAQGDYNIFVKDANDCLTEYANNPVVITAPSQIMMSVTTTDVTICAGNSDATISIAATGGAGSYEYSIDGGSTWNTNGYYSNLLAGEYNIITKDNLGCEQAYANNPVIITEPEAINIAEVSTVNVNCNGENTGEIIVDADGGNGILIYSIDAGNTYQSNPLFYGLPAGEYTIMVKDEAGCIIAYENNPVVISQAAAIDITNVISSDIPCNNSVQGIIEIMAEGGTGVLAYSIDNGTSYHPENIFTDLIADAYIVRVKDEVGCMTLTGFNPVIIEDLQPTDFYISSNSDDIVTVGTDVELTVMAENITSYEWDNGETAVMRIVNESLPNTYTYTCEILNDQGCYSESSIDVTFDINEGITTQLDESSIRVFPNPNTGIFTLELTALSQDVKVSVLDFTGKLVFEEQLMDLNANKLEKQFDMNAYERGVYFLRIKYGEHIVYRKVVLQ